MTALVKKLSVKAVCGDVKKLAKNHLVDGITSLKVVRFVGMTNGVQTGTTDNGDWTAFKGGFEGINLITGESFKAGKLFLPEVAEDMTLAALNAEGVDSVNLAFDIGIQEDDSSATGYIYTATPLMQVEESDPLEQLKASLKLPPMPEIKALESDSE